MLLVLISGTGHLVISPVTLEEDRVHCTLPELNTGCVGPATIFLISPEPHA